MARVSVLMPLRNAASTVGRSIESVLTQDFSDFEVVAVLNCCTDDTREKLESYGDRRIRIFTCDVPGIVPTLNAGLREVRGELIARQDGDDRWYPGKLRKQVEFLDAHKNIHIVGTQICEVSSAGVAKEKPIVYPCDDRSIKEWLLSARNPIAHPSVVFRREILLRLGGYDDMYRFAEDYNLWLRGAVWYHFANLPEVLVDYTVTQNPEYDPTVVDRALHAFRAGVGRVDIPVVG